MAFNGSEWLHDCDCDLLAILLKSLNFRVTIQPLLNYPIIQLNAILLCNSSFSFTLKYTHFTICCINNLNGSQTTLYENNISTHCQTHCQIVRYFYENSDRMKCISVLLICTFKRQCLSI